MHPNVGRFYPQTAKATGVALWTAVLVWASVAALPRTARADTLYRYIDERGVVHYTNISYDERYQRVRPPSGFGWSAVARSDGRRFDGLIQQAAAHAGVPPAIVKAVIHAESAFSVRAVSRAGAMGLMQLMPATARELGVLDPFRAEENVHGGARYLRSLHDRYGSWTYTLAAYNAGPTAVDRYQGIPPYPETQQYVRRVLTYYRRYHGDFSR
jgi:soluble lytic murein transglycosylase-like protein